MEQENEIHYYFPKKAAKFQSDPACLDQLAHNVRGQEVVVVLGVDVEGPVFGEAVDGREVGGAEKADVAQ